MTQARLAILSAALAATAAVANEPAPQAKATPLRQEAMDTANLVFENDGEGRFREVGLSVGLAYDSQGEPQGTMGPP